MRAMAEGHFEGIPAPSGIGEPSDAYSFAPGGMRGDATPTPFVVRRMMRDARRMQRVRNHRRSVMAHARRTVAAARDAARGTDASAAPSPLVTLAQDIAEGRFVRPTDTGTERLWFIPDDDGGRFTRHRPLHRNDYGTATLEAPGYMIGLERLHSDYVQDRREIESVMRDAPSNDGRGAIAHRAPDAVNGTEVRGMPRWHSTAPRDVRGKDGRIIDRTCYRVMPDGQRVPLVTTATAQRRKTTAMGSRRAPASVQRVSAASLPRVEVD